MMCFMSLEVIIINNRLDKMRNPVNVAGGGGARDILRKGSGLRVVELVFNT